MGRPKEKKGYAGERKKTGYKGVYFREIPSISRSGLEKVFYISFLKDGKVIEEKAGRQFEDQMTAAKANRYRSGRIERTIKSRKEIKNEAQAKKKALENKWTFSKLWDAYLENNPGLKGLKTDKNRFELHIEPAIGGKEPGEILPLEIDRLRLKMVKTHSLKTVNNVLELIRRLSNYGMKKQKCPGMTFKIELKDPDNIKTEDLTGEQIKKLIETIEKNKHLQAGDMMRMALVTGMRRGELFKMKWQDIDFKNNFIEIRNPKGGISQKIPLNDEARKLLESHIKTTSPYVFFGRGGNERVDISKDINKIKAAAGLPKGFRPLHGLRHVFASMLASSGQVDMYTLQKLLTHKSPQMTQRYAHLHDATLRNASDLAGDLISQALNKKVIKLEDQRNE